MTRAPLFLTMILGFAAAAGATAPDGSKLVKATLHTDALAVEAGKPFRVGVMFKIEPGYHIYWKNPGESGQPPEVKWKLPSGFAASELQWPAPKKFMVPGAIFNFGYDEEVMLVATITPPATLPTGNIEISADCSWLVCNDDACMPGSGSAALSFADASSSGKIGQQIDSAIASVPVPSDRSPDVVRVIPAAEGSSRSLKIEWKSPVSKIEFFPHPNDSLKISQTSISTNKMSQPPVSTIEMFAEPMAGAAKNKDAGLTVSGVLSYRNAEGQRRGIELTVPANKVSP